MEGDPDVGMSVMGAGVTGAGVGDAKSPSDIISIDRDSEGVGG